MDGIIKLLNEYGDSIYNFCLYLAKSKQDGDDLFQETFMKAMEISSKIDMHNNPKSFLMSIAINIWKNINQKKFRRMRIAPIVDIENNESNILVDFTVNVESHVIDKIMNDTLREILNSLDDKFRVPIILFYAENLKISEISIVIGKPEGTIKRLLHDAKKKIKKEMEGMGYE